jgi:DNA repair photolyase
MGLNESKGNMYDFVTHTWNTVKGACPHGCTYCYMRRFGEQKPVRFDRKELKTDLGEGNFIFVGSSCDMFAEAIDGEWIDATLDHCGRFPNKYLFQSKNPQELAWWATSLPPESVACTTIETNRWYLDIMRDSPSPESRAVGMSAMPIPRFVTIEPVIDFDLEPMVELIKRCEPVQVNIGADSGHNGLPEPPAEKVLALIEALGRFTTIARKTNLGRILGKV